MVTYENSARQTSVAWAFTIYSPYSRSISLTNCCSWFFILQMYNIQHALYTFSFLRMRAEVLPGLFTPTKGLGDSVFKSVYKKATDLHEKKWILHRSLLQSPLLNLKINIFEKKLLTFSSITEPRNHLCWKSPSRSSSPAALPIIIPEPPKCHIQMPFEHFQTQ